MTKHYSFDNTSSIGERIREVRQKKGITQIELAKRVGCASNTISSWEGDPKRAPNKKLIGKVAQSLGISIDYLLDYEQVQIPKIPCYGDVESTGFIWSTEIKEYVDILSCHTRGQFALKILDDFLEPIIIPGDYAIFEKRKPKDSDIVVVRFLSRRNKTVVKRWRQQEEDVMLLETNPHKICPPYSLHVYQENKESLSYVIKSKQKEEIVVEGKLVDIKRKNKVITIIHYNVRC